MEDGRLPKNILYRQLITSTRRVGCPPLQFKDAYKRDLKSCNISPDKWEVKAEDRDAWCQSIYEGLYADTRQGVLAAEIRDWRKRAATTTDLQAPMFICTMYNKNCHSRIRPHSHSGFCQKP